MTADLYAAAHRAGVERLELLDRVQAAVVEGEEPDPELAGQLAGPTCGGCDDCTVREVLAAAMPVLLELARAEARPG